MKKFKLFLFIIIILFSSINIVKADEGIVYSPRSCFGKTYGTHNNHWHEAVQNGNDWIAVGDPINSYPSAEGFLGILTISPSSAI